MRSMLNDWDTNTTLIKKLLHELELELYLMLFFCFHDWRNVIHLLGCTAKETH